MDLVSSPENLFYVINFKNDFKIDVFFLAMDLA